VLVSVRGEGHLALGSYAGLARRAPLLAVALALFLLSLAGMPPTAGFIAKVAVFSAAVQAGYWPLVMIAVIASVIAAFFYIRVIVLMYMQEPAEAPEIGGASLAGVAVAVPVLRMDAPTPLASVHMEARGR
jgi:NADH-quinone oxidoreductase subunit N